MTTGAGRDPAISFLHLAFRGRHNPSERDLHECFGDGPRGLEFAAEVAASQLFAAWALGDDAAAPAGGDEQDHDPSHDRVVAALLCEFHTRNADDADAAPVEIGDPLLGGGRSRGEAVVPRRRSMTDWISRERTHRCNV